MTRTAHLALGIVLALGARTALAQQTPVRSISVSGTAETHTAPDLVVWRISLTDTGVNLLAAKALSDQKVAAVLALREGLGIAEGDIETGHVSVRREYERGQHGQRGDFKHFAVSRSVTIRQRDLKRFDEFLDALVSSAEMEVNFDYEASRMHEVRAETRIRAVRAARHKAVAMAAVADEKIGRALTINEHGQGDRWGGSAVSNTFVAVHSRPSVDTASERSVPGAIPVRVTVYATFELQ